MLKREAKTRMEFGEEKQKRVLIVGLDGGTFEIIKPFAKKGYLPNINRIMNQGCYGILDSTIPPITAPAWSSFMTGKNPGKHGFLHFFEFSPGEHQLAYNFYSGKFLNFSNIRESTLFELLGENGKEVISINMPITYPPREIHGKMISCWLTPPGAKNYTYPLSLREEYPDYRIDLYFGERMFTLPPAGKQVVAKEFFSDINDVLDKRAKTALSMISKESWDLFVVCFTETDRIQHFFWRAINPDYPGYNNPSVQEERRLFMEFYKKLDGYIGELIDWAEKRNAMVCIMSDHGFGPPPSKRFHMNYFLRENGYLIANQDNSINCLEILKESAWQYKVSRAFLRDVLGISTPKRFLIGKRADVTWGYTMAWSVCLNNNIGGIFFNRKLINIPIENFTSKLVSTIFSIVDPENGRQIVQQVLPREKLFSGEKVSEFPDLIYFLEPEYEAGLPGKFDLFAKTLISKNPYPSGRGNHNKAGIYLFYGKDICTKGNSGNRSIMDILPTILLYLQIPIPDDLDGEAISDIFRADKKPIYSRSKNFSYKSIEVVENEKSESEKSIRDKIKNLGYL
ncbi:MAG: hypothetical protein A2W05_03560 [Candidatus Schekmanbacteria bacterium RBG_16_38_10]|uniref:Phosphodiesterase n=1 Tax=Candidatus Schekmanbacteria bacterium RBG_16_38_10 TaxID=1817879 RepID=A0A1F7S018_9BACT|nr:MAG: hypothetical protein A2W05_03560 [Candidatus Schekmanbacteria bacterium RBG_16_38_10]